MAGDNFRRAVREERACDAWARMCQELLAMGWGRRVEIGRQKTLVKATAQSLPGETASRSMRQTDSDMGKEMPGQGEGLASLGGEELTAVQKGPPSPPAPPGPGALPAPCSPCSLGACLRQALSSESPAFLQVWPAWQGLCVFQTRVRLGVARSQASRDRSLTLSF